MNTDLYQEIEELIKTGQSDLARKKINRFVISKIPRNRLASVADLCRRAGLPEMALKVLKPVVRPQNPNIQASPQEMAYYGQSLVSIGGGEEAIRLLNKPDVIEKEVKSLLFLSFAYFSQWNYQAAIPHLEKYLQRVDEKSYTHSVGQVNYAAALIAVRDFAKAETILQPLIKYFDSQNHNVLAGNCRELLAQIYYHNDQLPQATPLLDEAKMFLGGKQPDTLFVEKWQALIRVKKEGASSESLKELNRIKIQARKRHHWETVRDLELQQSLLTHDLNLYNQVYFGTPFPRLREKIQQMSNMITKKTYIRNISETKQLNLFYDLNHIDSGDKALFKTGSLYHRLFLQLANDFYRPLRIPTLFSRLYPDEYFEPECSSQKVKMLISRLRKMIKPMGLEVLEMRGTGYTLGASLPIGLVYREKDKALPQDPLTSRWQKLLETWPDQDFRASDMVSLFNISSRSASRWLKEMVDEGTLIKLGEKKGTRYRLGKKSA